MYMSVYVYAYAYAYVYVHVHVHVHMVTSSNGSIFRVTGHLCGEFTGPRDEITYPFLNFNGVTVEV